MIVKLYRWLTGGGIVDSDGFPYDGVRIPATTHNTGDDAAIDAALETAIA